MVWTEQREISPYTIEVRAQRVDANGNFLWGGNDENGVLVSDSADAGKPVAAWDSWTTNGGLVASEQ